MSKRNKRLAQVFPGTGQWDMRLRAWCREFHMEVWKDHSGYWIVSQGESSTHFAPQETDPVRTLQFMAHKAQTRERGDWVSKTYGRNCMMQLCLIFNLKIYDERYKP